MSRVDFYILADENRYSIQHFACRLAEKAYLQGHKILIKTESVDESHALDNLLWTIQDNSFIPHALLDASSSDDQAVLISHEHDVIDDFQLLINLSSTAAQHTKVDRIAEVLNQQANSKQIGREHYKIYRDLGLELHHHEMKPS